MKLLKYVFLLIFAGGYGQAITVDDKGVTKEELVAGLLDNSCVQITNIAQSDKEAVAYFSNNSGDFPISEGVIIRSGKAKLTEGAYSGQNLSTQINTTGDPDLQVINNASGQSTAISDVAYLEFEFVPLSENFSFDFIFASNEYGQWQCASSDVFAFLLTEIETGETRNIAVVPGTNAPVSVRTIKDRSFNENCQSDNPEYFASYQVDAANSVVNMRGYTKLLTAAATIKPGKKYRIKLVIGDSHDLNYDSAIFIAGGSFRTDLDLGADRMLCEGTFTRLNTGLEEPIYKHQWFKDDVEILNETSHFLDVNAPGNYMVKVTKNDSSCDISDRIKVESLTYNDLPDIVVCDDGSAEQFFDLTNNGHERLGLSSEQYDLVYYSGDVSASNQIKSEDLTSFKSRPGETIFVKLKSKETEEFCNATASFNLEVNESIRLEVPDEIVACKPQGSNLVNLSEISDLVNDQLFEDSYVFELYRTAGNADQGVDPVVDISNFQLSGNASEFQVFGKVQDTLVSGCFNIFTLNVSLNDLPPVSVLQDVVECDAYVLPAITDGNYYTRAEGEGRMLQAGDVIENSGTYYIYNLNEAGCSNQSSFKVELIQDYKLNEYYCEQFVVPSPPAGAFYDAPDGPDGGGQEVASGTVFTSDFSIYYYGEMEDGSLCKEEKFDVAIYPLPEVDKFDDVVVCNGFILPELTHGEYYTNPNGGGQRLKSGVRITTSMTLYVYNDDGRCNNEDEFKVRIIPNFEDVIACGSYTLPELEIGEYFASDGSSLQQGAVLTESTEVFYTAETTDGSDCAKEIRFFINITPIPDVDRLQDVTVCLEDGFVLPEIKNGEYFTEPDRQGEQLLPGDKIFESKKIFINNIENSCTNESSFNVEVRELAPVENFVDVYSCFGYELPELQFGRYYTKANAQGEELAAGTYIEETRRIYIYNEWEDLAGCANDKFFTIYIEGVRVDRPEEVNVCDLYVLPKLNEGEYFTESGGKGKKIEAGTEITANTRLYIYKKAGVRFVCEDEYVFDINVSRTPNVATIPDIEVCGSYKVPNIYSPMGIMPVDYEMFYTTDLEDDRAILGPENVITEPGTYTMYLKAQSLSNDACYNYSSFNVTVYPLQDLEIEEEALCVNTESGEVETGAYFYTGLDPRVFEVNWYYQDKLMHTGPEFEAMQPGEYIVKTTKIDGKIETGCGFNETSVFVKESAKPEISVIVTEPFEDIAVVNVEVVKGRGDYLYSLDGGEFQPENEFYDVASGTHTVEVKGVMGYCGVTAEVVEVLKHPKFFTPNSDGFNDTWNITELETHPEAEIHIYDRYGAYITKIKPAEGGWDGSKDGSSMPSNDYWFEVGFQQDGIAKTYRSHFSLKR
ncbi:T9SS type B sorting domain-containing protein [Zunongwangia sp. SCSIO 43204]|uniref:T9SS type B sorting domain-containing protein n=1 Tax=Zunongwangia sp. SCSIO 43204 TaxID=2779359 RepID=UPI001CA8EA47|nr:choice-of-anchor L domain-containing protein [Zunongwangia sp. SCSIO 43204]UAB84752.1 T9SS type B sorting domain-containing protein [Zunongwangia sp. SCSIO 43204]